jgi:hypothetical protein
MSDPLRQIKQQPWGVGLQISVLTVVVATLLECLLMVSQRVLPILEELVNLLYAPTAPFSILTVIGVGMGMGALTVALAQGLHTWLRMTAGALWTLVACLVVAMWVRSLLPIPLLFNELSLPSFVGILLGASWKSWPQWRY